MKTGLVIGKFYPPHKGHKYLIGTAEKAVDRLIIIVCERDDQKISGDLRAKWLRAIHPHAEVLIAEDIKKDNDPYAWAEYIKKLLGLTPDVLFTSEDYGERYAGILGSRHTMVDRERTMVPITATEIRENPLEYKEYLEPCVYEYFLKNRN
ncbi:MAG: adenylyltransferase/cytidyltransferase family protein [Candidatus Sungbacteria bacterium]|nr:adenylyltransferase/cytidyltransferase family protein [Candidatus Sungbacteria bacterium]